MLGIAIRLETFLRGMETEVVDGGTKSTIQSLKPSLEGWKPLLSATAPSSGSRLETFLRGMETPGADGNGSAPGALKPSLEGWKQM